MNHQEVRAFAASQGIVALESASPFTPEVDPTFQFNKQHVLEMIGFWLTGFTAMKLLGPQGCGKTKLVEQFHAALNYPLLQPQTHARTEAPDLNGQTIPTAEGFRYVYGHLVNAAKAGCSVFIDEWNVLGADVTTSLNPILEAGKIDIAETGESILPAQGFRVFAACNPNDKSLG